MVYKLNPLIVFRPSRVKDKTLEIALGSGSKRYSYFFTDPQILSLLLAISDFETKETLQKKITHSLKLNELEAERFFDFLIKEGIILSAHSPVKDSQKLWEASNWRDAHDFHLATQDLIFNSDQNVYWDEMGDRLQQIAKNKSIPFPPPYKEYLGVKTIALQRRNHSLKEKSLQEVLTTATPFREYKKGPLSFEVFSELLLHTYGVTSELRAKIGLVYKRTSPSGGARHPIESYVYVHSVSGVDRGIYHYHPKNHNLELIKLGDFSQQLTGLCFEKGGVKTAPVVFMLTVRWFRHMWKYRYARSYRMILYDTGHIIQTHLLNSAALRLQSFPCPSFHDKGITELLDLNSDIEESPIYVIGTGLHIEKYEKH